MFTCSIDSFVRKEQWMYEIVPTSNILRIRKDSTPGMENGSTSTLCSEQARLGQLARLRKCFIYLWWVWVCIWFLVVLGCVSFLPGLDNPHNEVKSPVNSGLLWTNRPWFPKGPMQAWKNNVWWVAWHVLGFRKTKQNHSGSTQNAA